MFYLQKSVLNIIRHKVKSVLVTLVCTLIVLFLFLYIGGIQANRHQLSSLPEAMPVYARISNLNGTMTSGMLISDRIIKGLENSIHVTDYFYTVRLGAALGQISKEGMQTMDGRDLIFPLSMGVNNILAYPGLTPESITFLDDSMSPAFLEGDDAFCIVRAESLERYDLAVGDTIWLTMFYHTYPNDNLALIYKWLGTFQVKIVGSYGGMWNASSTDQPMQIVFPVKWLQKMYEQADVMFFADSARFRVADPLELNAFKSEMKELNLMPIISQAQSSIRGNALSVNDETFVRAAGSLMDNIALMQIFTPFLFVIVGLTGFVVSYLLMHSRKPEIAIMRSMGMSEKNCFTLLFLENAMLDLSGSVLGILAATFFIEINAILIIIVTSLFFACYMAGTAVALKLLGKFSVMAVMSALE